MKVTSPSPAAESNRIPPRQRILEAASDLFYRHGIRPIGVDAIAETAGTNKMTLYRHFPSKDELVAEYLRGVARQVRESWDLLEAAHPDDPRAQLDGWVLAMGEHLASKAQRGCAFCNAAIELPERDHPARRVVEEFKTAQRSRLIALCEAARISDPETMADELFLLLEGARVSVQSMGPQDIGARFVRMAQTKIADRSA
jgi:AcrR family transcriptional regulator